MRPLLVLLAVTVPFIPLRALDGDTAEGRVVYRPGLEETVHVRIACPGGYFNTPELRADGGGVVEQQRLAKWLTPTPLPSDSWAANYWATKCTKCHGTAGKPTKLGQQKAAMFSSSLMPDFSLESGQQSFTDNTAKRFIGGGFIETDGGVVMPAFGVTDGELEQLLDYVRCLYPLWDGDAYSRACPREASYQLETSWARDKYGRVLGEPIRNGEGYCSEVGR